LLNQRDRNGVSNRACPRTRASALWGRSHKRLLGHDNREGNTMRGSVIAFCAVAAATTLTSAILFTSSGAQAIPLAAPSGFKAAIHQSTVTQKTYYACRRGLHGRRCHYVSRANRILRYDRSYAYDRPYSGGGPSWNQPPLGPFYYWAAGPLGND
jgi:hypothetical protein